MISDSVSGPIYRSDSYQCVSYIPLDLYLYFLKPTP